MPLTSDELLLFEGWYHSPPLIEPVATALETQREGVRDVLVRTPSLVQHGEVDGSEEGVSQHCVRGGGG